MALALILHARAYKFADQADATRTVTGGAVTLAQEFFMNRQGDGMLEKGFSIVEAKAEAQIAADLAPHVPCLAEVQTQISGKNEKTRTNLMAARVICPAAQVQLTAGHLQLPKTTK